MSVLHSIVMGIIQGLTEFLPISSKTHLTFAEQLLKFDPKLRVSFDVLLHLGTALALIVFFLKRIVKIVADLFSPFVDARKESWDLVLAIVVGSIPALFVGFLVKDKIDALFETPTYSAIFLLVTGAVLFATRKTNGERTRLTLVDAAAIGVAQALAILPGISRSGMTISTALFLGLARPEAFEFSLLLSIPAILGAGVVKLKGSGLLHGTSAISHSAMAAGFLVSAGVGILALHIVRKILMQRRFWFFSFYCWLLGAVALIFYHFH